MRKGAIVLDEDMTFLLAASLEMKGKGKITIGGLHQRLTRFQFGKFVLGGGILHDSKRQEINYFFYPGDFKPPLSVYFSGYRPAEGFEGFGMMKGWEHHSCSFQTLVSKGEPSTWELKSLKIVLRTPSNITWTI